MEGIQFIELTFFTTKFSTPCFPLNYTCTKLVRTYLQVLHVSQFTEAYLLFVHLTNQSQERDAFPLTKLSTRTDSISIFLQFEMLNLKLRLPNTQFESQKMQSTSLSKLNELFLETYHTPYFKLMTLQPQCPRSAKKCHSIKQ